MDRVFDRDGRRRKHDARPPQRAARKPPPTRPRALARTLSRLGLMSRAMAQRVVEDGRVTVNGKRVLDPEARVEPGRDIIGLDGRAIQAPVRQYLALNKPRGLVTTARDEHGRPTVYDCLRGQDAWLAPVGRLDQASEGLLLFSNDPEWAQRLLDPSSRLPKVYHVHVDRPLGEVELARLRSGLTLPGGHLARAEEVRVLRRGTRTCWVEIVLHQGLNRQIRRMLRELGVGVLRLVRVAIGPVRLGDLAKGEARPLREDELQAIAAALGAAGHAHRPRHAG